MNSYLSLSIRNNSQIQGIKCGNYINGHGDLFPSFHHKEVKQRESFVSLLSGSIRARKAAFSASMRDRKHWNPKINQTVSTAKWNVTQIAMSKNTICTNLIIMLLHKSKDKLTHRKCGQVVYLLCNTFCIFLGTIKKRTSSGMSFSLYVWPGRRNLFRGLFCLPCSRQDNESWLRRTHGFLPWRP